MVRFTAPVPDSRRPRTAWVAGSTGLVGSHLLPLLLAHPLYRRVHALGRRLPVPPVDHAKLRHHTVAFDALPALPATDDVYIALGTTLKAAGSRAAWRAVDLDAVVATARAARETGARRLAVVSAVGADPRSWCFHQRIKGEMEEALAGLGFTTLAVARPSLLLGDRSGLGQPARPAAHWAERLLRPALPWLPSHVQPIAAGPVARALVQAMLSLPPGVHRLARADMLTPDAPW